jgi:hypothetical protein
MILAFLFYVGHTLPILHSVLHVLGPARGLPHGATLFFSPGTANPFHVSRPKAVVYFRNNSVSWSVLCVFNWTPVMFGVP